MRAVRGTQYMITLGAADTHCTVNVPLINVHSFSSSIEAFNKFSIKLSAGTKVDSKDPKTTSVMISNYLPTPNLENAPPIIRQLRAVFDDRLTHLHEEATRIAEREQDNPTKMVHVPFAFAEYEVEAMYDKEQDLFTQLVARPLADRENARPSFTISVFLVIQ